MRDEELRRRYQDAMQQRDAGGHDTPDPELVLRVARGEATEAERLRVLDVVMQSEELRREYDVYRALVAGAHSETSVWPRRLAAAALIAVVVGAGYWALFWPPEGVSWRGGGGGVVTIFPANGAKIAAPVRLVWHLVPGAREYQIELMEENGRLVAEFQTPDTVFVVPVGTGLRAGTPYRWGVTARQPNGESANSPLGKFTVRE